MIKSMTGYGRGEYCDDDYYVMVEIKSVNHRFYECTVKSPKTLNFLDDKLKNYFQTKVSRGKIDIFVTFESKNASSTVVEVNEAYLTQYLQALNSLQNYSANNAGSLKISDEISLMNLALNPEVLVSKHVNNDEDEIWSIVKSATDSAAAMFIDTRESEGKRLKTDILSKLDHILSLVSIVENQSPITEQNYRERIEKKIRELLGNADVDEQRIITETAIFADKIAVDEETVRLKSHIKHFTDLLNSDEAIGKKLDFVVQEMNREANTIGSKCQDVEIAHTVVDIKSEIEKIREQIQNIE